jgi:mannose-6-phosphate isomerase-like protein (cupin superfamily)
MRRIVTGEGKDGRSRIVADERLEAIRLPGSENYDLWSADAVGGLPAGGEERPSSTYWPRPGGYRFFAFTLMPEGAEQSGEMTDVAAELPTWSDVFGAYDPDDPGMHRSDTVDFLVVLSGEVVLELDEGEVTLGAGDSVVQNGTRHRWANRGTAPATLAIVLLGAPRE